MYTKDTEAYRVQVMMMARASNQVTVLIAEDEPSIQEMLESCLLAIPGVRVVGKASSGSEALSLVEELKPDALFLDVKMPGLDGLSLASIVKTAKPETCLVFVTAHPGYAVEAFQVDATDYIVKPITAEAVAKAITKVRKQLEAERMTHLHKQKLTIRDHREVVFIEANDIVFVEKLARKTIVHTIKGPYTTTEPLSSLEKRLPPNFFRCHKSFIINMDKVEKISPIAERIYRVSFYDYPKHVTMGKDKLNELYDIMSLEL